MTPTVERAVLAPEDGPKAIGPYSVGVRAGDFIFVSGTIGVDPETGEFVPGGVQAQTRQALLNMSRVLESGGSSLGRVVKTTVFLRDMAEFAAMNAVYAEFFQEAPPARSTVQASLPKDAAVEIEAIALTR